VTPERPTRYEVTAGVGVADDLLALASHGEEVIGAAESTVDDLAQGRKIGKRLGPRGISGDLTGFFRIKFDIEDRRPQRFRLLYRQVDHRTYEILAIGVRDEHAIYRAAVARLIERSDAPPSGDEAPGS
jgi:hypothetical protein